MLEDPTFWVAIAFLTFVALAARPVARALTGALDARSARIRAEIEEAQALREEAQKSVAEFKRKQRDALKEARKPDAPANLNGGKKRKLKKDNLQDIVGIGKVFEHALNDLGVYTFAQIAAFDIADVARVNSALKECKGRMEQDDWIGQARELHFKKYGEDQVA